VSIRLDSVSALDRQIDGQTDRQIKGLVKTISHCMLTRDKNQRNDWFETAFVSASLSS